MASTSNLSLPLQLRNKDLRSKLKLICKGRFKGAAHVDRQLIAATAQIISQFTDGVPVATQISQVMSYLVGAAAARFETSHKLKEVLVYAEKLQKNIYQLPTDDAEWQSWLREEVLPKLYAQAYSLNTSRQVCTCLYKLVCAQQINIELHRLANTIRRLNNEVNQKQMLNRLKNIFAGLPINVELGPFANTIQRSNSEVNSKQMLTRLKKPCTILAGLPATAALPSAVDILAGRDEVLKFLNIGKPGIRVLCIVGIGGVGKTTLMDALSYLIQKANPNSVIARSEIGQNPAVPFIEFQQKIVSALVGENVKFNSTDQGRRKLVICFQRLQKQNRPLCLCVDNIWQDRHLLELFDDEMYKNLPSSSYLILTTRTRRIAESFKSLFSRKEEECMEYKIQKLSLEKAKQVFMQIGERKGEYLNDELVDTIVPLCDGLPLALRVYATYFKMHKKEETYYKDVALRIKEARDSDSNVDDDELWPILEASIDFQKEYVIEAFIDAVLFWRNRPYDEAKSALIDIHGRETCSYLDCLSNDSIIERGEDGELRCHDLFIPLARKKAVAKNWIYVNLEASYISLNQQRRPRSLSRNIVPSGFSGMVRAISTTNDESRLSQNLELLMQSFDLSVPRFISFMSPILCNSTLDNCFRGLQNLSALYITILQDTDKETKTKIQKLQLPQTLSVLSLKFSTSALPDCILQLNALQFLDLSSCCALAMLPDSIGQLVALQSLNLGNCYALVALPDSIGQLIALQSLNLCSCKSITTLPNSIGQLIALQSLNLGRCFNLVALPNSIGQLAALRSLDLRSCKDITMIPDSIGQLAALQSLKLNKCVSLVALTDSIGQLGSLQSLGLRYCEAIVALPNSIGQLAALQSLDLSDCRALITLPNSIGQLVALQSLCLGNCHALATLPDSIGQLAALQSLVLDGCYALAALPDAISQLSALQSLDLFFCVNLAVLPNTIGQLATLHSLDLSNCRALATLPDSIGQLTALKSLNLYACRALTSLPDSIGQLATLQSLNLGACRNLDMLPDSIGQLASLHSLNLRACRALATLPDSIGQLAALKSLDLQTLRALVSLPDSIGQLVALHSLDLHDCRALTMLPNSIGQLAALQSLDLHDCRTLVAVPDSIGQLTALQSLNLRACYALTALPHSIGQLAALQSLNLRACRALATLPDSIGHLVALQSLNLRACRALIALPNSIGQLAALQSLDLCYCRALATLPDSISQLNSLQSLNLHACRAYRAFTALLDLQYFHPAIYRPSLLLDYTLQLNQRPHRPLSTSSSSGVLSYSIPPCCVLTSLVTSI